MPELVSPTIVTTTPAEFADHLDAIATALLESLESKQLPAITVTAVYAAAAAVRQRAAQLRAMGRTAADIDVSPDSPIRFRPRVPSGALLS